MINYDSILSAFDGKPTLLQWLKLIKKALDESVLRDITLKQDGANVVFTFNFEDGTSISTPAVTLPKGDTGAKGDKGEQGVSVTGVDEVSNEVVGSQTLTTLRFNFSNGTNNEVIVHAENGKDASGGGKLYKHIITAQGKKTSNSAPYYAGWTIIDNHSKPYTFSEIITKYYYYDNAIGMPILVYSPGSPNLRFLALLTYQYKIVVGMTVEPDFGTATNFKDTVTEL